MSRGNVYEAKNIAETSHAVVEIKIKTLDSQVYTCQVPRNVSVPALKEQIASVTSIPAGSQRLICRGKVLKDEDILSAYNVEDGHTLHLVTRPAPQPNPPAISSGITSEDQDSNPLTWRNRSGQVSHNVVLGTFNIPEHGDGAIPEINRILSSVLSLIRIGNAVPTIAGVTNANDGTGAAPPIRLQGTLVDRQGRGGNGGRPQGGTDHPPPSREQRDAWDMGPPSDSVPGLQSGIGIANAIPVSVPQIRHAQQAMVPDPMTTLSQYLNRMEQLLATNGHEVNQASIPQTQSLSPTDHQVRADREPAAWAAIIRRTQELLSNQAGSELVRLADQLGNESNLNAATIHENIVSAGILMQNLGTLLLELGRITLMLRMGSSLAETGVTAEPTVLMSGLGPNSTMGQVGGELGSLTGMAAQPAVGSGVAVNIGDTPRNINIHIHAGNVGLPSAMSFVNPHSALLSPPIANAPTLGITANDTPTFPSQTIEIPSRDAHGNMVSLMQAIPGSMQGPLAFGEHGTVRVLPMRSIVAAVPMSLHTRPPLDAGGAGMGVFYPLLARFQQLNPPQFSHQSHANSGREGHSLPPRDSVSPQQEPSSVPHPAVQTQVQVQTWLQSQGQVGADGQVGSGSTAGNEEQQDCPYASSGHESRSVQQQSCVGTGTASNRGPFVLSENNDSHDWEVSHNIDAGAVAQPLMHSVEDIDMRAGGSTVNESDQLGGLNELAGEVDAEALLQLKYSGQATVEMEQRNCAVSSSKSIEDKDVSVNPTVVAASSEELKEAEVEKGITGSLGLHSFQPLPCRKRTYIQDEEHVSRRVSALVEEETAHEPATTCNGETVLQDFLSTLASRREEGIDTGLFTENLPRELSHVLQHVGNDRLSLDSRSSNMGEVTSHIISHWSPQSLLQDNSGITLGTFLSSGGVRGPMEEDMLVRTDIQKIKDDAHKSDDVLPKNFNVQCTTDSGLARQEMHLTSQIPCRVSLSNSECASSPIHESNVNYAENGATMDGAVPLTCSDRMVQFQESSVSVADVERRASDISLGDLPAIKRQKTQ